MLRGFSAVEGDHGSATSTKRRPGETLGLGPACCIKRRHTEAERSHRLVSIAVDVLPMAVGGSPYDQPIRSRGELFDHSAGEPVLVECG